MGLEVDITNSNCAVTQETKLSLSIQLLQQNKSMVGQIHVLHSEKEMTYVKLVTHVNLFPQYLYAIIVLYPSCKNVKVLYKQYLKMVNYSHVIKWQNKIQVVVTCPGSQSK